MLSTVVAGIGLIENNVAVVIGAMVIAPLWGPHLALSLGTALGDTDLMKKAARTLLAGILLAVGLAAAIGVFRASDLGSVELLARAPAPASIPWRSRSLPARRPRCRALTTGLSSVLVGVMVAVALLPPAASLGIMRGAGEFELAAGAGLLLAVNVLSVDLASKIVFFVKGIHPRTWLEKEKARRAMIVYVTAWLSRPSSCSCSLFMPADAAGLNTRALSMTVFDQTRRV